MPQTQHRSSTAALCALALTTLLSSMSSSIVQVGLPTLAAELHSGFTRMQWVVLAYLLAVTASALLMGWLSDRLGRQRLLAVGVLLFTGASLGCGLSHHVDGLIGWRLLQGVGGAIMLVNGLALVMQVVPADRSGRAMGMMGSLSAIGTAAGPALGGLLIAAFGWRALFFINLLPGLLLWLLIRLVLPAETTSLTAVPRPEHPPVAGAGVLRTAAGVLRQQRVLSGGLLLSLIVAAVMMTTLVVGPFYLTDGLHLSVRESGLLMALGPLVAAAAGFPAGRLVDRIGTPRATLFSLLVVATGCVLLAILPQRAGVSGYALGLMLLTAGYALFQAANGSALLKQADPARRGWVSALLNVSRNLGFISGAGLMAAVYAAGAGSAGAAEGLRLTFTLAAAMVLLALGIVRPWRRPPPQQDGGPRAA